MMLRWCIAMMCLGLMAGCGEKPGSSRAEQNSKTEESGGGTSIGPLRLLDYAATPPASWTAEAPSNNMRLAQFLTPGAEGSDPGEAIVFFFGSGQGGSVEANLQRWSSQVKDAAGSPVQPKIDKPKGTKFPTTVAEYNGTYTRTGGMGVPSTPKDNQTMIAAIMETPKGSLFLQLTGSAETVDAQREAFMEFVKSVN